MDLFRNSDFRATSEALDMLWLKQQVLSHNIANAQTPGFKAKRVDFQNLLDAKTVKDKTAKTMDVRVYQDNNLTMRLDGNNVDVEKESLDLVKAQMQYEYLLRKISGQFTGMKYVISEGRR